MFFCVFFSDRVKKLVIEAGFEVRSCDYIHRQTVNKKEGLCVPRIFVQGKFIKQKLTGVKDINVVTSTSALNNIPSAVSSSDKCVKDLNNCDSNNGSRTEKEIKTTEIG